MRKNIYDIYDLNGKKVIGEMTGDEISKALNVTSAHVSKCAIENKRLLGKYRVVKVSEEESGKEKIVPKILLAEWDKVTAPLRKVIWVKEYGPGVRKLSVQEG